MTPIADVLHTLSSSEHRLSVLEAEKRLSQYGYNEILEKKKTANY
ncbi:MAG: cation-transporting P-type ATPase [Candidatus Heimdallarchaeota archaeon]